MAGAWVLRSDLRTTSVVRSRILMGTELRLRIIGDDAEAMAKAADAALDRMFRVEQQLSRFTPDSDVSRLNAHGSVVPSQPDLVALLTTSQKLHELGDGVFDTTVQPLLDLYYQHQHRGRSLPSTREVEALLERVGQRALTVTPERVSFEREGMKLTLDGIGKGYVLERGLEVLQREGYRNVFLEAGGDLIARGRKPSGEPWTLGIQHPRSPGIWGRFALSGRSAERLTGADSEGERGTLARGLVSGCAVATSGDYMQSFERSRVQHHILDPRTGRSAPELASATVVATDAAWADGLATLVMTLGPQRGRDLLESLPDCEGCLITKNLDVVRTAGFHLL